MNTQWYIKQERQRPRIFRAIDKYDALLLLLGVILIGSAFGVIYCKHETRKMVSELEMLRRDSDRLHVEWTQLLLEQGAWASNARIDRMARESLNMHAPNAKEIGILAR